MKKIRGMPVNDQDKLIIFDVKNLFAKVPIDVSLMTEHKQVVQMEDVNNGLAVHTFRIGQLLLGTRP